MKLTEALNEVAPTIGAEVTPSIVMTSAGNAVTSSSGAALTTAKFLVTDIATRNDDPK